LGFTKPYLEFICFEKNGNDSNDLGSPEEFNFKEEKKDSNQILVLNGFNCLDCVPERQNVFIGDRLIFINKIPVGAGCKAINAGPSPTIEKVMKLLRDEKLYPMRLTFARQSQGSNNRWGPSVSFDIRTATTVQCHISRYDQLGCIIEKGEAWDDIVVKKFHPVPGRGRSGGCIIFFVTF